MRPFRTSRSGCFALLFLASLLLAPCKAGATLPLVSGSDPHVFLILDPARAGDMMQLKGVADALKTITRIATVQEIPVERKEQWIRKIAETEETAVVLTINREGIDLIETLRAHRPKKPKNLVLVHISHQLLEQHNRLAGKADIIALPRHAVTLGQVMRLFPSRVALTRGVPHALSETRILAELKGVDSFRIPQKSRYLTVVLGGDVEMPNGSVQFYTPEEAARLARYVARRASETGSHILVLNGPRTGRYDPSFPGTREERREYPGVHRDGTPDPVTTRFVQTLAKAKIPSGQVTVFDFQWGKPDPWLQTLGLTLSRPGSHMLVPGESVSRISESADILPSGTMTVYLHGAMNESHKQYVMAEWRDGKFDTLDHALILTRAPAHRKKGAGRVMASETVARAIAGVLRIPAVRSGLDVP
jgi:hypothetical protein